jgi:hypothetical protein
LRGELRVELGLAARTAEEEDHVARDLQRELATVILLDQRER